MSGVQSRFVFVLPLKHCLLELSRDHLAVEWSEVVMMKMVITKRLHREGKQQDGIMCEGKSEAARERRF